MTLTWTRAGRTYGAIRLQSKAGVFNEEEHPRDRKGRFIETGAEVRIWGGALAKVLANIGGGNIEVQVPGEPRPRVVHRNYLTVVARPDGSAPTDNQADVTPAKPVGIPSPDATKTPNPPSASNSADVYDAALNLRDALGNDEDTADRLLQATQAFVVALDDGTPDNEADERAALLRVIDEITVDHPYLADEAEALRTEATAEPDAAPPVDVSRQVPNTDGDPVTVAVGDAIRFTNEGDELDGTVTGFTTAGGPMVRTADGEEYPLLPDASKWQHQDTQATNAAPDSPNRIYDLAIQGGTANDLADVLRADAESDPSIVADNYDLDSVSQSEVTAAANSIRAATAEALTRRGIGPDDTVTLYRAGNIDATDAYPSFSWEPQPHFGQAEAYQVRGRDIEADAAGINPNLSYIGESEVLVRPGSAKRASDATAPQYPEIDRADFSNPDTPRTRAVTSAEFQTLAAQGKQLLDGYRANASDTTGLNQNWDRIKQDAYDAVQQSWGGVTIDAHTGDYVPDGDNRFALSVKPRGMTPVSVPEDATPEQFDAAMEQARRTFADELRNENYHLGVFHDDDNNRIDIDPVLVVDSTDEVDRIGSYTHAVGGAYSFADGNGYWPPYVNEQEAASGTDRQGLQGTGSVAVPGGQGPAEQPQAPEGQAQDGQVAASTTTVTTGRPDADAAQRAGLDDRWKVTGNYYTSTVGQLKPGDTIYTSGEGTEASPVDLPVQRNGTLPEYGRKPRTVARVVKGSLGSPGTVVHFTDGTSTGPEGGNRSGINATSRTVVYSPGATAPTPGGDSGTSPTPPDLSTIDFNALGRQAHANGESSSPALNQQVRDAIAGLQVGDPEIQRVMGEFRDGWHAANLAATQDDDSMVTRPTNDPVPIDPVTAATVRPVFDNNQRPILVSLNLDIPDTGAPPIVQQAAARVRGTQPLTSEQADALANHLRQISDNANTPTRQRFLKRLANIVEASSVELHSYSFTPAQTSVDPVKPYDLTPGDHIAIPTTDGVLTRVVSEVTPILKGRINRVVVTNETGDPEERFFTGNTGLYLVPDLPDPEPTPLPPEPTTPDGPVNEHISADRLQVGDTIRVPKGDFKVVAIGEDRGGNTEITLDYPPDIIGFPVKASKLRAGEPVIVRTARGPLSQDQPYDSVMSPENPTVITHDQVKVGDRVTINMARPFTGYVLEVEATTGVDDDGRSIPGSNYTVRMDNGDINTLSAFGDDPVTRLVESDHNAVDRINAAAARRARQRQRDRIEQGLVLQTTEMERMFHEVIRSARYDARTFGVDPLPEALAAVRRFRTHDHARSAVFNTSYALRNRITDDPATRDAIHPNTDQTAQELWDRVADNITASIDNLVPLENETPADALNRLLDQWETPYQRPRPDLNTIADSLAAAAHQLGDADPVDAEPLDYNVDLPADASIEDRVAAYKKFVNADSIGRTRMTVSTYQPTTLDALERGEVPEVTTAVTYRRDTAPDGGPGEEAMRHLTVLRTAGADMDAAVERRMAELDPDLGPNPHQAELDAQARLKTASSSYTAASKAYESAKRDTRNRLAVEKGYKDYQDLTIHSYAYWADTDTRAKARADESEVDDAVRSDPSVIEARDAEARLRAEYRDAIGAARETGKRVATARRQAVLDTLSKVRSMGGVQIDYRNPKTYASLTNRSELVKAMRFAESNYPTDWLNNVKAKGPIQLGSVRRGYWSDAGRNMRLSKDSEEKVEGAGPRGRVATHELGHANENANPFLELAQDMLLWDRTATGEVGSRRRVPTKRTDGMPTYADEFPESYTGKEYPDSYRELLTTAMESLMGGSPYMDEDIRRWLLGLLALC